MEEINIIPKAYYETIKRGKVKYKSLHWCRKSVTWPLANDVKRIVAMSDIHGATTEVVHSLIKREIINSDTIVICTGDMGGKDGRSGGLLDPTDDYQEIRNNSKAFYFVQGNHDLDRAKLHSTWKNSDGTPCYLHGKVVQTPIGRLGGVDGIVSYTGQAVPESHIYLQEEYDSMLRAVLQQNPAVLLTHTPLEESIGSDIMHLFGHDHAEDYYLCDPTLSLNMDGRIFIWE